jgi:iron(III) transport system ATP-binding protein
MTSITLDNIAKRYGLGHAAVWAVRELSLTIEAGEFFFLLGPSGCGKTTLLRMIAGLIDPTAGRVLLGERDVTTLPVEDRRTALVFQNYALWPHMTVYQNVEFGPRMRGKSRRDARKLAEEHLARVRMGEYGKRKPNQLSGGQQQRVALARALASGDPCLLMDEPLSNLDAKLRAEMRTELRRLVKTSGATGVYVTHDQKEALSMADRIGVMHDGRLVQTGTPQELYNRPATRFVADFLGEANFIDGSVTATSDGTAVTTASGVLRSSRSGLAPESKVTCCVRPERIGLEAIGEDEDPGEALSGTVETRVYLGEMEQLTVRLVDGSEWRVSLIGRGAGAFSEGQRVRFTIPPEDVTLLDE